MKLSKLVNEWNAEQEQVIQDLKEDFRKEQIKSEGNDPKKTNQSFGTPHDIASMHTANRGELLPGQEQEHVAGPGRPADPGTFGTHSSPHGRDPLAIKQLGKTFSSDKSPLQPKFKGAKLFETDDSTAENVTSVKFSFEVSNLICVT